MFLFFFQSGYKADKVTLEIHISQKIKEKKKGKKGKIADKKLSAVRHWVCISHKCIVLLMQFAEDSVVIDAIEPAKQKKNIL